MKLTNQEFNANMNNKDSKEFQDLARRIKSEVSLNQDQDRIHSDEARANARFVSCTKSTQLMKPDYLVKQDQLSYSGYCLIDVLIIFDIVIRLFMTRDH